MNNNGQNNNHKPTAAETFMAMKYGTINNNSNANATYTVKSSKVEKKKASTILVISIIAIVLALIIMVSKNSSNNSSTTSTNKNNASNSGTTTEVSDPDANLKPVSVSNGEYIVSPKDYAISTVTVKTSGSYNYYVYLKNLSNSNNNVGVYIKGGNDVDIEVPEGKYTCYYCVGETWYGKEYKFGSKTLASKFMEILDIDILDDNQVRGYTLTLYAVKDGNAITSDVDMDDFPD